MNESTRPRTSLSQNVTPFERCERINASQNFTSWYRTLVRHRPAFAFALSNGVNESTRPRIFRILGPKAFHGVAGDGGIAEAGWVATYGLDDGRHETAVGVAFVVPRGIVDGIFEVARKSQSSTRSHA